MWAASSSGHCGKRSRLVDKHLVEGRLGRGRGTSLPLTLTGMTKNVYVKGQAKLSCGEGSVALVSSIAMVTPGLQKDAA